MSSSGEVPLPKRQAGPRRLLRIARPGRSMRPAPGGLTHAIRALTLLVAMMFSPLAVCAAPNGADVLPSGLALIMIEEHGCGYCRRWLEEVGPGYAASDEGRRAPLIRVDRFSKQADQFSRIVYTPTFVLVRDGKEQGRILGYPGPDFFWSLLADLMRKLDAQPAGAAAGPAAAMNKP